MEEAIIDLEELGYNKIQYYFSNFLKLIGFRQFKQKFSNIINTSKIFNILKYFKYCEIKYDFQLRIHPLEFMLK